MLRKSDTIGALVKSLILAQAGIKHAVKDAKNPHFRNDYATLESVIEAVKLPLLTQGLVIIQTIEHSEQGTMLITTLAHESGEWASSATPVYNEKGTAQGMGSGLTYARRYALAAMLMIGQTDDDGNEASVSVPREKFQPNYSPASVAPPKPIVAAPALPDKKALIASYKAIAKDSDDKVALSMSMFGKRPQELTVEQLATLVSALQSNL